MKNKLLLLLAVLTVVGCDQVATSSQSPSNGSNSSSTQSTLINTTTSTSVSTTTSTSQNSGGQTINTKLYAATIDNNVPDNYYDSCKGLKGEALKTALHNIIKDHKYFTYSSTTEYYKEIDKDPHDSSKMYFVYTGSTSINTSYNKEHVWAKSHGGFEDKYPMHSDLHNLHPCNSNLNSTRGNLDFGEGGDIISGYNGNNKKTSSTFEPSDFSKGDVARTIFYMAVRYEGTDGELDLEVSSPSSSSYYDFSKGANGTHGNFNDLYKWATSGQDPVDDYEVHRNNTIYSNYQKNRNPFIDHPEFVQMIYDKNYTGPGALLDNDPLKEITPEEAASEFKNMVDSIDENNVNSKTALEEAMNYYSKMSDDAKELAKETYQTLLKKIAKNNQVIDEYYYSEVINKINQIGEVTLDDKELIEECERLYALLTEEGKAKVTNYQILVEARKAYNELYEQWLKDNPIQQFTYLFGQVSGAASKYDSNKDAIITYDNKSFRTSYCYKSGTEFRLGYNSSSSVDSKFSKVISNINSNSASLESLFNISAQKLELDVSNSYGTVNNIYLLKSLDDGETYTLEDTQKIVTNSTMTFNITPGYARYAFVIDGTSPRLVLTSLKAL